MATVLVVPDEVEAEGPVLLGDSTGESRCWYCCLRMAFSWSAVGYSAGSILAVPVCSALRCCVARLRVRISRFGGGAFGLRWEVVHLAPKSALPRLTGLKLK